MKGFAQLLERLVLTPSRNRKLEALSNYFRTTPDPDRGFALGILTGSLRFRNVRPAVLRAVVTREVDPYLFALSHDYVGDLGETIALIWPHHRPGELPGLADVVELFNTTSKARLPELIAGLLTQAETHERWALVKLATGALRIGVSARLAKTALAAIGAQPLQEIEEIWHGLAMPYVELFAWLEGRGEKPGVAHAARFHPMMLAQPLDPERDLPGIDPGQFAAEWKWDGIRVQLSASGGRVSLFSRTGDDIAAAFPDIVDNVFGDAVLDGELLVGRDFEPGSFNDLQQRLNRKRPTARLLADYPAFIRCYDMLFLGDEDIRALPWSERRARLQAFLDGNSQPRCDLSPLITYKNTASLARLRAEGAAEHGHEGIMLKRRSSPYLPGRPKGLWYKWKRDPNRIDAVLMYAQRGHGKRSSYYSDYTFGVWKGDDMVPVGKAYFGFTDAELKQLDKWIRNNTVASFGPVREVKKQLVFEVAFDSAQQSSRHKSGVALRFPRISRIRWDKPAVEAATLDDMLTYVAAG